jgi:hypothetical protein
VRRRTGNAAAYGLQTTDGDEMLELVARAGFERLAGRNQAVLTVPELCQ